MRAIALSLLLALGGTPQSPEVTVFAAASLTDVLEEAGRTWEARTGSKVAFHFAASSTLARQVRDGAPADLFLGADASIVNALDREGFVAPGGRRSFVSNTLCVVVAADRPVSPKAARELADPGMGSIAVADPQTVPAGIYARQWLGALGLWERLQGKLIPTDNVRAALATVEAGNADAAIVYRTDAAASRRVRVAFEVPPGVGPRISYGFALLREARAPSAARRFLDWLASPEGRALFRRHGFLVPD